MLRDYGEEKFARKVATAIVREREKEPFARSGRLVELLYAALALGALVSCAVLVPQHVQLRRATATARAAPEQEPAP